MRAILFILVASLCRAQENTPEKLIDAGHWKRARTIVERRLAEAPADANACFLLSQIRNAFGDRTSPQGLAEKAVRLDARVARYHRQLAEVQGMMALHAGVFQQLLLARRFRKELDTALRLDPRDVQARRDLLEFYLLAPGVAGGDRTRAEAVAAQIAALDAAEGFLAQARLAEVRRDRAQMEAMLLRAAGVQPPSYRAQMALAQFYLTPERRNDAAAEAVGRSALAIDRKRSGGYCVLAAVYAGRGDWSALEATLSAATGEVPDDGAPYYQAAERILAAGLHPARAEQYLRQYLAQEPEGNQPTVANARALLSLALAGVYCERSETTNQTLVFEALASIYAVLPTGHRVIRRRAVNSVRMFLDGKDFLALASLWWRRRQ
jgi:hypothetical protein